MTPGIAQNPRIAPKASILKTSPTWLEGFDDVRLIDVEVNQKIVMERLFSHLRVTVNENLRSHALVEIINVNVLFGKQL